MDTSNSTEPFTLAHLMYSVHDEDRKVATKAIEAIEAVLDELQPVLRYLCGPVAIIDRDQTDCDKGHGSPGPRRSHRAVIVIDAVNCGMGVPWTLFLHEDGRFFLSLKCRNYPDHFHVVRYGSDVETWGQVDFVEMMEALKKLLASAEAKREKHLESIRKRTAMLDAIVAIAKQSQA